MAIALVSLSQSSAWWDSLTVKQQNAYLERHSRSKFRRTAKDKSKRDPKVLKSKLRRTAQQLLLDADTEPLVRNKKTMVRQLNDVMSVASKSNVATVYNTLDDGAAVATRCDSKTMGLMLKQLGSRDRSPSIYRDVLTRMFRPKDPKSFSTFMGVSMSVAKMALGAAVGAAILANPLAAAAVAAYFVNSIIDGYDNDKPKKKKRKTAADMREEHNQSRKAVKSLKHDPELNNDVDEGYDDEEDESDFESDSAVAIDPAERIVNDFISYWSTIDHEALKDKFESSGTVLESTSSHFVDKQNPEDQERIRMTLRTCPTQHGIPKEDKRRFLICVNGTIRGFLSWDTKMGRPNRDKFGWLVTLYHGFNENSYRSGRNPHNDMEPFTAVHRGELKLHNPCRMPIRLARAWARQALRR